MLGLRRQLAEENEQRAVWSDQTLSLRKQISRLQSLQERLPKSTATINYLERALLTKLTTPKLNRENESRKGDLDKAAREASASRILFAQLL